MKLKNPRTNSLDQKKGIIENNNRLNRILAWIIFGIGFFLYWNTLHHNYVLDDFSTIADNSITTQGPRAIVDIFTHHYRYGYYTSNDGLYRPLPVAIFALEWWITPNNPSLAHLVNILLYALTGYFIFMTFTKLMKNYNIVLPLIVTMLFITHPIHTEVVANIKSLDEILGFLFSFAALNVFCDYFENKSMSRLGTGMVFFFLALISKESTITMVAGIPLCFLYFRSNDRKEIVTTAISLFAVAILFLIIRFYVLSRSTGDESLNGLLNPLILSTDSFHRFTNEVRILVYYLKLLIYPSPLLYDYSFNQIPLENSYSIPSILSILIYVGLFIYGVIGFLKKHLLAFGVLFYLVTLSIFSNMFFLLGVSMAERFIYFASFGFCFSIGLLLMKFTNTQLNAINYVNFNSFFNSNKKIILICSLIGFIYSIGTISRNRDWKDNFTLFSHDIEYMPKNARAHSFLGNEIIKTIAPNENDRSTFVDLNLRGIEELKKSIEIYPKNYDALNCLGSGYLLIDSIDNAEFYFKKALEINPKDKSYLASAYFTKGEYDKAIDLYSKIINDNPKNLDALVYLGIAYGTKNNYPQAIDCFKKATIIQPKGSQIYYYLSSAYKLNGDSINAEQSFQQAYKLDPSLERP